MEDGLSRINWIVYATIPQAVCPSKDDAVFRIPYEIERQFRNGILFIGRLRPEEWKCDVAYRQDVTEWLYWKTTLPLFNNMVKNMYGVYSTLYDSHYMHGFESPHEMSERLRSEWRRLLQPDQPLVLEVTPKIVTLISKVTVPLYRASIELSLYGKEGLGNQRVLMYYVDVYENLKPIDELFEKYGKLWIIGVMCRMERG